MTFYNAKRLAEVHGLKDEVLDLIDTRLSGRDLDEKSAIGCAAIALCAEASVRAAMSIEPTVGRQVATTIKNMVDHGLITDARHIADIYPISAFKQ